MPRGMRTQSHTARTAFRRAVWGSVALHVVAAVGLFVLVRSGEVKPRAARIDTRAPDVRMQLIEVVTEVEVRPEPTPSVEAKTSSAPPPAPPPELPATGPRGPFAPAPPRTLPPELLALLRKPGTNISPVKAPDPNVRAAGVVGRPVAAGASRALHGALKPAQAVVYVLDCSGSMGAAGKFGVARAALAATLAQQPATVRFQVVVYDGTARAAVPGGLIPASAESIGAVLAKLAALEPRGKSNHLVALRAALDLRPEVVVWLTDADELTAAVLKPVLKSAARPVPVCVGLVTPGGVQQPHELK